MFRDHWKLIRQNWKVPAFWRWWWQQRVTVAAKLAVLTLALLLLIAAGYFTSVRLAAANAANGTNAPRFVVETTVTRIVTTKENGKTVIKRVPVAVKRTVVKSKTKTVIDREIVTAPGKPTYVVRTVIQHVPVVRRQVVHDGGKTKTLTQTQLVPTTQTVVDTITNQSTVVQNRTTTNTVTQPVTTVRVRTVTRETTTTLPADTVTTTRTETRTQTETRTRTETVVETVTTPAVTITITLPLP